jgi:hypothetical protein
VQLLSHKVVTQQINIALKNADEGGEFICKNPIFETSRIKLFSS